MDEFDLYEAEHADDFEALDDLQIDIPDSLYYDDLPQIQKSSDKKQPVDTSNKRKSFEDDLLSADSQGPLAKRQRQNETSTASPFPDFDDDDDFILSAQDTLNNEIHGRKHSNLPTMDSIDIERIKQKEELALKYDEDLLERIKVQRSLNNAKIDMYEGGSGSRSGQITLNQVLVVPPRNCPYMSATSSNGQRVYMRIRNTNFNSQVCVNETIKQQNSSLLAVPVENLRQRLQDLKHSLNSATTVRTDTESASDGTAMQEDIAHSTASLWVNKFAPRSYGHLLSDEGVNRALLRWLKLWDKIVFKREVPQHKPEKKAVHFNQNFNQNAKSNDRNDFTPEKLDHEQLDETNRPKVKVAMLCGAPGLGKTTLAHIIAKHAGYHVVEINASDDRSPEAFKRKIEETTQMKSVLMTDNRPNCLIIDEIDGASKAAINVLLNTISNEKKNKKKKKSKKSKTEDLLSRPIICICNDLYIPALRLLRQQSYVLEFPSISSSRLASRLTQMCRVEKMTFDMTAVLSLCEKSGNDVRTCINTLQFVKSLGNAGVTTDTINRFDVGVKDQNRSIFYVWGEIFQLPKNKRKMEKDSQALAQNSDLDAKLSATSSRFYHILNCVQSHGDYGKTIQGVFENFLRTKMKNVSLGLLSKVYDWMQLYDDLNYETQLRQEFILMRYMPYLFVLHHMVFATVAPPKISYPRVQQENRTRLQRTKECFFSMLSDMKADVRCYVSPDSAMMEVIPHLRIVMAPQLRPVNKQLYTKTERKQVDDLVHAMISYNLTYKQQKNEDGAFEYNIMPDVKILCQFDEVERTSKQLTYAAKQMIAKEIETEKMRIKDAQQTKQVNKPSSSQEKRQEIKSSDTAAKKKPKAQNHLQRLTDNIKGIKIAKEKPYVDFFRKFTKTALTLSQEEKRKAKRVEIRDPGIGNSHIWFKFNEGYSNAVRKTVYVKDIANAFLISNESQPTTTQSSNGTDPDTSLLNTSFD